MYIFFAHFHICQISRHNKNLALIWILKVSKLFAISLHIHAQICLFAIFRLKTRHNLTLAFITPLSSIYQQPLELRPVNILRNSRRSFHGTRWNLTLRLLLTFSALSSIESIEILCNVLCYVIYPEISLIYIGQRTAKCANCIRNVTWHPTWFLTAQLGFDAQLHSY